FYLLYSRDFRALLSFPTRRSSDLGYWLPSFSGGFPIRRDCARWANDVTPTFCSMLMRKPQHKPSPSNSLVARTLTEKVLLAMFADRKSTRLNSSHLGISYAVFCLK